MGLPLDPWRAAMFSFQPPLSLSCLTLPVTTASALMSLATMATSSVPWPVTFSFFAAAFHLAIGMIV